jgi:hypothetical protein
MKLRSGTTFSTREELSERTGKNDLIERKKDLIERVKDLINNPTSLDIDNLIYGLRLYESLDIYLDSVCSTIANSSYNRLIIVNFWKSIEMLCQLIGITYTKASIEFTDYTKGLLVKTMYKINDTLTRLGYMLRDMEYGSDYIYDLLQISINKKGEEIDKESIEASVYYCYRYFYKSQQEDSYNISSYADGQYTEVEIYDYYFKENASKDKEYDLLIKNGYNKWFVCAETTDRYDIAAYDKLETTEDEHLLTMCELKELRDYHTKETEKYASIISKKTYQRMKMMNSE